MSGKAAAHEVRIIGGQWRRSKLPVLSKPGLRPTPDRVRETLFNWLGQDLVGWQVLDMFAGTGALGMEAASRGAAQVLLIEQDAQAAAQLKANAQRLNATQVQVQVLKGDAFGLCQQCAKVSFDLIFIDPPFAENWWGKALLAAMPLLKPQGFVYVESSAPISDDVLQSLGLQAYRQLKAGAVYAQLLSAAGNV
jgi:16S rRNA (guanine966-N2)-methyltransferase